MIFCIIIILIINSLKEGNRICHSDFNLDNVFIIGDVLNNELINETQTIDWTMAARGNPIGDFAKTLVTLEIKENKKKLINTLVQTFIDSVDFPVNREELDKWKIVASSMMITMLSHVKESKVDLDEKNQLDQSANNHRNLIDKLLEKYK